jgi:hypothetical protein
MGQTRPQFFYRLLLAKTVNKAAWQLIDRKDTTVNLITQWLRDIKKEVKQSGTITN